MILTYIVRENDTLESIAEHFYHDRDKWQIIAEYNKLDYPYISSDPQNYQTYASGTVVFSLPYVIQNPVVIPAGTQVTAPTLNTQITRYYIVTATVTINPGSLTATANVRCTMKGTIGNVGPNRITQIIGANPYGLTVTNPTAITNGKELNIATTGSILSIPLDDNVTPPQQPITDYYAELCKTDIVLTPSGEFTVGLDGDLLTVTGIDNLTQDLKIRLETAKGDYIVDTTFGTNLLNIATNNMPQRETLMELEIKEVILADPRVKDVTNVSVEITYPTAYITAEVVLANDELQTLTFSSSLERGVTNGI